MSIDIPPELNWLVEMAAGQSWPQGDEDKLSELGDGWNTAAVQLHDVVDGVGEATSAVQGGFNGPAADQFTSFMNSLYTSIPQMAQGAEQIGSMAKDTALQIEYSKYMILLQLLWMAEQIAEWTSTIFGAAAVPAIEAAGRFTVQAIIKTLMKQVARSVGESVAAMVGMDVAVQTIQFLKGDRTHWNTSATIGALEMGALSGAVGGIVGVGAHVIAPDIMKTFVGHVGLGAANGAIIGGVSDLVFGSDGNIGFAAAAGALGGAAGHRRGGGGGPGPLNLHIDVDDDPGGPPPAYHKVADDQPPPYSARPEPAPVNGSGEHSSANGSSNGSVNGTANGTGNSTANNTANGAAHGGGNTGDESNIPLTSPAPDYTAASAPAAAPAAASGHETGTDTPAEDQASSPLPATESADAPAAATGTGSASASTGANGAARGSDSSSSAESSTATSSATSGPARSTSDSSSGLTSSASPSTGIRTTSQPSETAASGSSNHYSGLPGLESTTPQPHAAAVGPTAQVGSGEAHSAQAPATQHVSAPASTPTPHESATATPPPAAHAQSPQPTQTHPTATSSEPLPAPHATTAPAAPHTVESPQASHTSQTLHSAAPAPVAHDSSSAAPASGDQRPAGLPGLEGGPTPVAAQAEAHAAPQPDDHAATESPAPTVGAGSSAAMHTPASGPTRDSATGDTSPPPETELPPPSVRTQSDTGSTQHTDPATASPTSVRTESEPAPASDGVGETRAAAPAEAPAVSTHSEDPSPAPNGDQHVTFGSSGGNDSRRAPGAGGDDFSNLVTRTLENSRGRFGRAFVGPDDQARLEQHIGNFDASIGQVAHVAKNGDEWESSGPRSQVPWDPTKPHYIAEVHTSDDGGFSVAVSSGKTSLTPGQFGGVLRRRPSFTGRPEDAPLVLAACEAARPGPDGIAPAQHLADETGATVYAPTSDVVALEDGTGNFALTNDADGNRGAWVKFEPRTVPAPEPVRTVSSPGAHGDSETSNPDVSHSGSNAPVTFTRGGSSSTARPAAGHQDRPGQQQPHAEQPQQAPNTGGHGKIVTRAGGRVVGKPTNAVEADFYRKIRALPEDDPLRQIVPRPYTEAEVAHLETQIAAGVEHPTLPTGPATEHPAGGTDHPAPTSGPSVERPAPSSDHPAPAPAPAAAPAAQHPAPGHDDSQVLIENITHGMNDPHLLDVKIGARTASRTELERHLSAVSAQIKKWKLKVADKTTGSSSRGYRVVGGTGIKSGTAGERATAGRASDTHIRGYAAPEEGSIQDLAHQLHQQVLHIADVVKGSGHTAIAASVLMAVDRHPGPGAEGAVQAKLIDFAHTFGPDDPGMSRDQFDKYSNNFDEGIRNLAKTLGDIAESQPARPGHDEAAPSTSAPPADTRTTPAPIAHQHTETDTPAPQDSTTAGPADRPAPAPTPRSGSGREPFTFGDRSTRTPIRLETGDSHAPAEAPHTRPDDTAPVAAPANTGGHAFGPGDEGMSQAQYDKYADNFNDGINNLTRDLGGIAHDQAQAPAAVADPRGSRPAALGGDSAGDRPPVTTDPSADRPAAPPATESAPVTSDPSEDRPAPPASGQHVAFGSGGAGDSHSASGAGHGDFTNLVTHTLENSRGRFGRAFVGPDDQARLEQHFGNFDASIGQIAHLAMNGDHWEPTGERSEVPWDPTKPHYIAEVHTSDEGNFNVAVSSGKTSLGAGQFGGVLRRRPSFTGRPEEAPLVLVACQAAVRGPDGVAPAQHLADETGATVYAPTSDVVALEDGTGNFALTTDADGNRGQWVKFEPRTSSTPVPEHGPALAQNHASSISSDSHPAPAPATGHEQFAFGGKDPRSSIQLETGPPRTSAASAAEQSHSQTEGAPPRATTSVTESQQAPNTGGHGGITTRAGGQVLEKPTNQIESDFYQMVRQLPADDPLRQVVPHSYTGAEVAHMEGRPAPAADQRPPGGGSGDSRIYIENITHGMTDPHLLDIKIGARTASRTELERNLTTLAAQIKKLKIKAVDKATGSSSRGYRVVGGTGVSGSGAIGRAVVGRESDTHIRGYTAPEEGSVQDLAHQLQQKVLEIADAVGRSGQTAIAASVLMAVDRHPGGAGQDSVRAKLIDFAHAFGPGDEGMSQDQFDKYNDNFDEGIRNLAKTLGDIAQSRPATSTAAAAADTHAADPAAHTPAPAPAPADRPATTSGSGPAREPFTFGDHSPGATAPAPAGHHETPETTGREPAAAPAPAPVSASVPVGGGRHEQPVSGQSSRSGKLPADAEPDVIDWSDVDEATQGQADAMTEYAAAAGRLVTTLAVHQQLVDRVYGAGSSHDESDLAENQRQLAEAEARFDTAEQRMVDVGMGDLSGRDDERLPETLTSLSADEFYTVMRRADEMLGTPHIVSSHDEAAAAREEQTAARVHVADELARGHEEQAAQSAAELGRRYFRRSGVGGGVLQVRNRDLSAEFQRHTQEIKDDITRQIAREEQIANAALAAATHRRTEQQQRVAQDYAAEIRRVEQVEARTSADLAARAELLRSRAQMYRPDQLAVYQRQLRDERRTLVTQSRDERARLGAIQRSALRDIDARYTQDRHQALEHLARVDATRRDVPDELIRRQRAALNRMVDNVVDSLMAEQRDARFYNARPMAARELAEFRRELPRIQTKLKKLVVDPKGYKGYHPILERNIGQHPDYGAKQHSVKVDNHTDLVRNVKGWVEAKPNRHREKLIARQVEADGHVERMVDVLSRRLYRHIQRLPNSEQIMAELGRGRSDFNGEPLGSYMPYFSRAKLPRELQHLATPIWDRGGIPAVLRDPGSFSLRDKMIAVHDLFEYFSTANHTPQTRGTNLLPVESDDNKYNTTAIDRRGRRIEATTDRGQNPVRQPDGRVRIHPSTRNENEPSTMLARDLRIPVWAGQSFTAMRMFKLAEWAGATKYEMGAVAWGIFSFWRLHYDHTTEYSYHTLHEVMDVAQNFGVSYSLLDQTASLGRVNPQSAVTDAIGLADNLLAGRVPVTDHGMVIDFDQSELTALAMNLTRAVRTAMDTGSSRNLRALLDAIQATEAQLGANVPL